MLKVKAMESTQNLSTEAACGAIAAGRVMELQAQRKVVLESQAQRKVVTESEVVQMLLGLLAVSRVLLKTPIDLSINL
jgi:hypothetical protein